MSPRQFNAAQDTELADIYANLPEIAKTGFVDKLAPELPASPWNMEMNNPDVSGTRKKVSGAVDDVMTARPMFKLPPITVDQSFLDANRGYNFNNLTATKQDAQNWNRPISQEWLDQYNLEMGFSDKDKITLAEVAKDSQLRRVIAQFALQDKADAVKAEVGPRPVPYNEIPVRTPAPKTEAPKATFGSKIASAAKGVTSIFKTAGKALSKLKFW